MPSNDLQTSYSPRRRRVFVVLSALSALFAGAGLVAWATTPGDQPADQPPSSTPHDLVTDGLGGPIAIETQAPTLRSGPSSAVVTTESREPDPTPTTAPTASPAPTSTSGPSFTCDTWSSVIQPGGIKRVGCQMYPAAFPGTVAIDCGDDPLGRDCRAEPREFDLRGRHAPIPFDIVVTTLYDTPPSTYTETIQMFGGSGQKHPFTVVVPPVVGTVSIDCPSTVLVALPGDKKVTCEVTSRDGFDGNVMLQGFTAFDDGDARILVVDPVRVPLGETVTVELTLRSTAVPLVPVLDGDRRAPRGVRRRDLLLPGRAAHLSGSGSWSGRHAGRHIDIHRCIDYLR